MNYLPGRAIVSYGRSLISLVIAHSLAKRGVEVITCDSVGMTATSFSKYTYDSFIHADPQDDLSAYLDDMEKFIRQFKPQDDQPYVFIPAFRDAKLIAEHIDRFSPLVSVAATDFSGMNRVDPKHHLMHTLAELKITAPKTWHPQSEEELREAVKACTLPTLIKSVDEVGGRGIDFIDNRDELALLASERQSQETPPPLIQEAVDGKDYCMCVLCRDGEVVAHMAYTNLQNMPVEGGAGAMRQTVDDAVFLMPVKTLMKELDWTGIAEIDFRWTGKPEDTPHLIEVNPRFWAGIFQSVESGIDFPWLLYYLFAFGEIPETETVDMGARTRVPGLWIAGALKDAFDTDADMEGVRAAWSQMKEEMKSGAFGMAASSFGDIITKATNFDEAISYLKTQSEHARAAKSELPLGDDPMSSLGVFFVLSSLIRHGSLPEEITR